MIRKIFNGKYMKYFIFNFVSLLVFWGGMLRKSFTSDTITHMVTADADVQVNLEQGRYLKALADELLLRAGLRTTSNISIVMGLSFIILAVTMVIVQMTFAQWEPQDPAGRVGYNLVINLWIYNVLFVENLMFSEVSIYFAMAYLLGALTVMLYAKRRYILMVTALAAATCFYQYAVIFAAIYIAFYIFLQERKISIRMIGRELLAVFVCVFVGVLNLVSILFLVKVDALSQFFKSAGVGDFKVKLFDAWESFISLNKDAAGLLPDFWIPLLVLLVVEIMLLIEMIKKKRWPEWIFLQLVSLGSVLLLYVIPLTEEHFYFPPRMSFCFFLVQGMILAAAYVLLADSKKKRELLTMCCGAYLLIQLLFSNYIVTNHFVSNTLDKVYVRMAYEYIVKYEQENGVEVENLCLINDINAPAYYDEVQYTSDQINERSLGILSVSIMEVMTGRKFNKVEMDPEVYAAYFEGKNWDSFDPAEQIIIDGNTAYWCMF